MIVKEKYGEKREMECKHGIIIVVGDYEYDITEIKNAEPGKVHIMKNEPTSDGIKIYPRVSNVINVE